MAYIYKIENKLNNKKYIGATRFSIQKRWVEHIRDSKKRSLRHRPLYQAIYKYGLDNFNISIIEECSEQDLNDREKYWINYYNTCVNGYNATLGGSGRKYYHYDDIVKYIHHTPYTSKIVAHFGCCADVVRAIAKSNNINLEIDWDNSILNKCRAVIGEKDDVKIIFNSIADAARFLTNDKKIVSGIREHISACCRGKRKSVYGYKWSYL